MHMHRGMRCWEGRHARSATYRNAVVNAALVLVDVGPGVAGRAKGRNEARRGFGDSVKPAEQHPPVHTQDRHELDDQMARNHAKNGREEHIQGDYFCQRGMQSLLPRISNGCRHMDKKIMLRMQRGVANAASDFFYINQRGLK
jgi:hypothetical protein